MESKELVVAAMGSQKHDIAHEVIVSDITNQIPATSIRLNKNSTFIIDLDCYKG